MLFAALGCSTPGERQDGLADPLRAMRVAADASPVPSPGPSPTHDESATVSEIVLTEGARLPLLRASMPLLGVSSARAFEEEQEQEWELVFKPYLWMASVSGAATVDGNKSAIDTSFSDIFDGLKFGIMGQFEAHNTDDGAGVIVDTLYLDVEEDQHLPKNSKDLTAELTVSMAEIDYYVDAYQDEKQTFQVLGGARYYKVRVSLDFPKSAPASDSRQSEDWVDPILGVRYRRILGDDWATTGRRLGDDWATTGRRLGDQRPRRQGRLRHRQFIR
jgi:hypothetical protein